MEKVKLKKKVELMDEKAMKRAMMRLSYEIVEKKTDLGKLVLVGIKTRGYPLAEMLKENLKKIADCDVPLGALDIKYYRDDLEKVADNPELHNLVDFGVMTLDRRSGDSLEPAIMLHFNVDGIVYDKLPKFAVA